MKTAAISVACVVLLAASGVRSDKKVKTYPEQGKVIAMHLAERTTTLPVYTDSSGETHGGQSIQSRRWVYRIETEARFYELRGGRKPSLELDEAVRFRLEKNSAYVQRGDKEEEYLVVGVEKKPDKVKDGEKDREEAVKPPHKLGDALH